jgi:hypothetical protein
MIQSGFEWWMNRTSADLDQWAAIHGTDPDTLRAVVARVRDTDQRSATSGNIDSISREMSDD